MTPSDWLLTGENVVSCTELGGGQMERKWPLRLVFHAFFFSFHFSLSAQLQLAANCGGCKRENSGAARAAGNFLGQLKASPKHGRTNLLSIHVSAVALMSALTFTLKRIRV